MDFSDFSGKGGSGKGGGPGDSVRVKKKKKKAHGGKGARAARHKGFADRMEGLAEAPGAAVPIPMAGPPAAASGSKPPAVALTSTLVELKLATFDLGAAAAAPMAPPPKRKKSSSSSDSSSSSSSSGSSQPNLMEKVMSVVRDVVPRAVKSAAKATAKAIFNEQQRETWHDLLIFGLSDAGGIQSQVLFLTWSLNPRAASDIARFVRQKDGSVVRDPSAWVVRSCQQVVKAINEHECGMPPA
eukprot:s6866_g5.t1